VSVWGKWFGGGSKPKTLFSGEPTSATSQRTPETRVPPAEIATRPPDAHTQKQSGNNQPSSSDATFELEVKGFSFTALEPDGVRGGLLRGAIRLGDEVAFRRTGRQATVTKLVFGGHYEDTVEFDEGLTRVDLYVSFDSFSKRDAVAGDVLTGRSPMDVQPRLQVNRREFAVCAAEGPAWCRLAIVAIPNVITALNEEMQRLKIQAGALDDLYNNSLLGVCVNCNEYCTGKAFIRMPLLGAAGDGVLFTGNSGGFERMLQGKCLNYSCESTAFDLFWCPDLDKRMLLNLRQRGINLDPNIQRMREHVWKPK
jgi:hypothetical protein